MKKLLNKTVKIIITMLLWTSSLFFTLGGLTSFSKSALAAIVMLLLGLILLPPVWKQINHIKPKVLNNRFRAIASFVLLIIAIQFTPAELSTHTEPLAQSAEPTTKLEVKKPEASKPVDQKEDIAQISYLADKYVIKGTGIANQEYTFTLLDGTSSTAKTDSNGNYEANMPKSASVFGYIELSRDTNGAWFGGKQTYDKIYYALTDKNPQYSNDILKPILLGIGGSNLFEASGYYLPNTTLQLRSGETVLATTKVDKTGRYQFTNIALDTNYKPITIYEKVTKGWFSSETHRLLDGKYLDTATQRVIAALPIIVKEESKKEAVLFGSQTVNSDSLPNGQTKVTQEGVSGEKTVTYQVTYKGNNEISRKIINEQITKDPITKITTLGTYIAPVYTAPSYSAPATTPSSGATAQCRDGSLSYSANRRGTCSHHGGVAVWY